MPSNKTFSSSTPPSTCLDENIYDAINWWENELTGEQRNRLLTKSWSEIGDIEKRHEFLMKLYRNRTR